MIAALVELLQANPDPSAANTAISILRGVLTQMTEEQILLATIGFMGDWQDYKSGVGTFARCLLYAYQQPNSPIKAPIDNNTDDIRAVLLTTANDACSNPPKDLFDNLNLLSILTAAKVLGVISP